MKEVTYEDWQKNPTPRMMWCWDSSENNKKQRKVIYIVNLKLTYPVVAISEDETAAEAFKHCAEIGKQRRMTNKELSWWLSEKPHRELKMNDYIYHDYDYKENEQDTEVTDFVLIREDNGKWREPLVEVEE